SSRCHQPSREPSTNLNPAPLLMAKRFFLITAVLILGFSFTSPAVAQNRPANLSTNALLNAATGNVGGVSNEPAAKTIDQFSSPLSGDRGGIINKIINILCGLIATVAVIFIICGGFRLVMSRGDAAQAKGAKQTITWAVAGLVVALLAFALIRLVIGL